MALDDVQVGDTVNVPGGMHGTIKYLGAVAGKPGKFAGIELAAEHSKRGKNNGDVDGKKYFSTANPGAGIFVPMNNSKYVTKRFASSTTSVAPPTTAATPAARPAVNFSKSVGPGPGVARPKIRQPSMPRPESPQRQAQTPSKLSLSGLRTPSGTRASNGFPRSPVKTPSRVSDRPPSRVSMGTIGTEDELPSAKTSDFPLPQHDFMSTEVQDLKDNVKNLERQLLERDKQLDEQANLLSDFQKTLEEMEGSDALSIRNQLREKNERIAQLTSEFDLHRADFRSTLDTLEIAASETERVYELRLEELLQQNRDLQDRGENVEAVARQLKQLEELVSELEEGLEDARRGEAEARAEVEFLRGEVERTKLELDKEREGSSTPFHDAHSDKNWPSKELDQKDDEIRGLKAIIQSLSRADPNLSMQLNELLSGGSQGDSEQMAALEQRAQEFEDLQEEKSLRIEELEQQLQQMQLNSNSRSRSGTVRASPQKPSGSIGQVPGVNNPNHIHRLSDRTVVPTEWPGQNGQHPPYCSHSRGTSESSRRLETMHESDSHSDDGSAVWCDICETAGHDILTCTSMFGSNANVTATANTNTNNTEKPATAPAQRKPSHPTNHDDFADNKSTPETSAAEDSGSSLANSVSSHEGTAAQKASRDTLEGVKGVGSAMPPVAGKSSGVIDGSKWCALCERDGHESIDCPFDD